MREGMEQELNLYPCGVQICLAPCGRSDEWKVMRTETKKIRFSPDEWATVEAKAKDAGITPSAWVRQAALNQLPAKIPELNLQAWSQLARLAANINQYQAAINSGQAGGYPPSVLSALSLQINALRLDLLGAKEGGE